jgi:Zinc-uptake complex component A periplasmic
MWRAMKRLQADEMGHSDARQSAVRFSLLAALVFLMGAMHGAGAATLDIVAAENFYGDIAQQIGGPDVAVTSILSNPDQDPHEFEASPSVARALSNAALVIYNGADYGLVGPEAVSGLALAGAPNHRRCRTRAQETRGQPAYLV